MKTKIPALHFGLSRLLALATAFLITAVGAWAQTPAPSPAATPTPTPNPTPSSNITVFANGLEYPRGIKFGPDGNLYVAEAGAGGSMSTTSAQCDQVPPPVGPYTAGPTARISKITPDGTRITVADKLPSSIDAIKDGPDGIGDIAFLGDTLYAITAGAGCSHGWANVPNAVLKVNLNGTTTQIANLSAFIKANPVAQPNPGDFEPDGVWYSMIAVGDNLFAIEPNHGELDMITPAGVVTRVADISATQGHIVPTVMAYDGNFYVGNLGVFPPSAPSKILKITPGGTVTTFATGFSEILGLAFDSAHRLYVLESSTGNDFPTPGTGKVVRVDNSGQSEEIASGLNFPTGMTVGPDGSIYVSNWGFGPPNMGQIVKISAVPTATSLGNISARGVVQTGESVLIGGFILNAGTQDTNVIVRGIGPSLDSSGVSGALSDPTIDLRDASGNRLAFNNDWQDDPTSAAKITAAGLAPTNPKEAAIYATLSPGSYTAILSGNKGATGVGLVEVYNLQ